MGVLSDDQFTALGNEAGASRYLHSGEQVRDTDPANRGKYAVSYPSSMGHEADPAHPAVRAQIQAHAQKMRSDPTVASNPRTMQGAWPYEGKVYLDASRMVVGRRAAVEMGHAGSQLAVRDMSRGKDVTMSKPDKPGRRVAGSQTLGYTVRQGLGKRPADVRAGARIAGGRG